MPSPIPLELELLTISVIFFISIIVSKAGSKFGAPALLLFLGVGMLFGTDGFGIQFQDYKMTQNIGSIALCVILFSGGLDTKISQIRPVMTQGILLATAGVLLTAGVLGISIWLLLGNAEHSAQISLLGALLLASTISSTDSASVFSVLRSKGLHLKNNIRPMLELESGSNDPMAYILTITLTSLIGQSGEPNYWAVGGTIVGQLIIGAAVGYIIGKLATRFINRIKLDNESLYPILLFTVCLFIFSTTYFLQGNAYLAVYVGGVFMGNSHFAHRRNSMNFFDGLAWLCQLTMFLTLGLLVNPHELVPLIIPGIGISLILIFVARPISVFISLAPFKKYNWRDKSFISWVGLRGAVPIIFAIIPLSANVPYARTIFNIVFLCTLISLIVQGTTLGFVAKWLKLSVNKKRVEKPESFDVEFPDEIKSALTEIEVTQDMLKHGFWMKDLKFPHGTLVIMVRREDRYFVPTGDTILNKGDKLLIVTDNHDALSESIIEKQKSLGIKL